MRFLAGKDENIRGSTFDQAGGGIVTKANISHKKRLPETANKWELPD
jgi:hypothetical protein